MESSRHQTAKIAAKILVDKHIGFIVPTSRQKRTLLLEFAKRNLVIYGKAFDLIKTSVDLDLDSTEEIANHLGDLVLYEIKSTNKPTIRPDFREYFFALTAAELLVAQNLKDQFRFAFVNTLTHEYLDLTLSQVFAKAKGIYPTWSVRF